jgi:hypothetical protein
MKKTLFILSVVSLFNSNLLTAANKFKAIYNFDRIVKNKIIDSGDEQIDGILHGPYSPSKGKKGLCISFNGVDNSVSFPAFFCGAQDQLSLWICPASNPQDPIIDRFNARFDGSQLDFDRYHRVLKNNDGQPDWGVVQHRKIFKSRLSGRQYVFACDTPFSGFRMQAWLSPIDGTFRVKYASPNYSGKLQVRGLKSKSRVWVKNLWTKIELRINQKEKNITLYINGNKEAETTFYTASPRAPYGFLLGASRRNGLPFYGKIDEFKVESEMMVENWIFPEGNFEYIIKNKEAAIDLPFPFQPLALDSQKDQTAGIKTENSIMQRFIISAPDRGIFARVYLPYYKEKFSLSFKAKSAKSGKIELLISASPNFKFSFKKQEINTTKAFKTYKFDGMIEGKGNIKYFAIKFKTAGIYWLDDICVY